MSRRIILSLIAGIGIAALPIGVRADGGNATTQPAANTNAPATQPAADATTQPAADANAQAAQPNVVVRKTNNGFTIITTGGMSVGPGQVKDIHTTFTVTAGGGNIVVQQGVTTNPPATQPADTGNAPATQPAGNGG